MTRLAWMESRVSFMACMSMVTLSRGETTASTEEQRTTNTTTTEIITLILLVTSVWRYNPSSLFITKETDTYHLCQKPHFSHMASITFIFLVRFCLQQDSEIFVYKRCHAAGLGRHVRFVLCRRSYMDVFVCRRHRADC